MRILNKNGIHFVVDDNITELKVVGKFKNGNEDYTLAILILEEAVLLLPSSESNRWKNMSMCPFLKADRQYINYGDKWYVYNVDDMEVTEEVDSIDNIKNTSEFYENTTKYYRCKECDAITTYIKIPDDAVYSSFEQVIANVTSFSIYNNYGTRVNIDSLLDFFSDTDGNKLSSYYKKYTTLDQAVNDKYDIALIKDSNANIDKFINSKNVVKCSLSYGSRINAIEAIAYCNIDTSYTLITAVRNRILYEQKDKTVIHSELDNFNIYGNGYNVVIHRSFENFSKTLSSETECLPINAFNIAKEISSQNGNKCVITSNPNIAYQLVTGKNVTTTGFWKDIDGNSLKRYFKKTTPKQLSVTHEHTQKIEGLGEVINEVFGPLVETVNNLADTVNNLAETVAAKNAVDEVVNVTETSKKDEPIEVVESSKYTIENFIDAVQGVDAEELEQLCDIKPAIMLQSYPGTGKTTTAIEFAKYITQETNSDRVLLLSFNQETSYTDTIGGVRRVDAISDWKYVPGLLYNICDRACKDKPNPYVIILDEINRANTAGVLGELISAMSKRNTKIITNSGRSIVVPENLLFIGTMNSFDESTTKIDSALQDRFMIYPMPSVCLDCNKIKKYKEKELGETLPENIVDGLEILANAIRKVNEQLRKHPYFGDDNQIGNRALYNNHRNVSALLLTLKYDIKPKVACKYNELDTHIVDEIKRILKDAEIQLNILCEKDK